MQNREIIFEFRTFGASTQVRAIDVSSGTEIAVTVPSSATKEQMIQAGKNKLNYVLNRNKS